jgi:hypothetical protein
MRLYVSVDGQDISGIRPGDTPENAISYDQLFEPGVLENDQTIILLPGRYLVEETLDLTPFTGMTVYGDGKVIIDGSGGLDPAIKVGSTSTVTGVRFKNCIAPLVLEDGATNSMVANCFDYHFRDAPEGGQSFTAKNVVDCLFKNLTSRRDGIGISVFKGIEMINCLSVGFRDVGRPGYVGELLDRFDNTTDWRGVTPTANYAQQMQPNNFYEGDQTLLLIATNATGPSGHVRHQRNVVVSSALDMSRGNKVVLVLKLLDVQGLVAGADAYRFFFESPAGTARFDLADTALSVGFNVLEFDLTSPTATTGALDLSQINVIAIETKLNTLGTVQYGVDHLYALDSSLVADFNAVELFEGQDLLVTFKGANGIDTGAFPPPFQSPSIERFQYSADLPNFNEYMTQGKEAFPIGAMYGGGHLITNEEPGHLRFTSHVLLGPWTNDETFYDTELNQPGPDGEGLALPVNELGVPVTVLDGETVIVGPASGFGQIRDLDDNQSYEINILAGALTTAGIKWTFGSPLNGNSNGETGFGLELRMPTGGTALLDVDGADIKVVSAGGDITGRVVRADLRDDEWNEILVDYATPFASSGAFDPSAITEVHLIFDKVPANAISGILADHLFFQVIPGPSTGPAVFGAEGSPVIGMNSLIETRVARIVAEPFLCRNVGAFIQAGWHALEDASEGSFVNRVAFQQQLITRSIQIRFAEFRFGRYSELQGAVAQDWANLTRITSVPSPGVNLWVQARIWLRNRSNIPQA